MSIASKLFTGARIGPWNSSIFIFHPTSLVPVEGVITTIRVTKTDHDLDPECSLLGSHVVLDIRYMTYDSNSLCY